MTMTLIQYLNDHFYTRAQLLQHTQVSEQSLKHYQAELLMPKASYRIDLEVNCHSYFGEHQQQEHCEYYAKGYAAWLGFVHSAQNNECVFQHFAQRYQQAITALTSADNSPFNDDLIEHLPTHIANEWQHFLTGTYGLCTRSGLPEDIAVKELAIAYISQFKDRSELNAQQKEKLTIAVNLLDKASALFAPHERQQSSRAKFINEMRRRHKITGSNTYWCN